MYCSDSTAISVRALEDLSSCKLVSPFQTPPKAWTLSDDVGHLRIILEMDKREAVMLAPPHLALDYDPLRNDPALSL